MQDTFRQVAALHSDHYRHVYYTTDIEVMEHVQQWSQHLILHNNQYEDHTLIEDLGQECTSTHWEGKASVNSLTLA